MRISTLVIAGTFLLALGCGKKSTTSASSSATTTTETETPAAAAPVVKEEATTEDEDRISGDTGGPGVEYSDETEDE